MIRKYLLPLIALGGLVLSVYHVAGSQDTEPEMKPPYEPVQTPFAQTVAGAGIVEASTENIAIGSPVAGIVTEVFVRVGDKVAVGAPLFRLDDRRLNADLVVEQAALKAAEAELARLEAMPRVEEIPVREAQVLEAQANLDDQQDQLRRDRSAGIAVSKEEVSRQEHAVLTAKAQLARVTAERDLLKAGAWAPEKMVAQAAMQQAQARIEHVEKELDRLTVKARVAGQVLQVNVRPGEFAGAPPERALIVLGEVGKLHVRVDIDEHDIPRFQPGRAAHAMMRGRPKLEFPLTFVRVEPFVIPKRSLTGDNTERVDTRVLQVIYELTDTGDQTVYVGQQLDVFIEARNDGAEAVAKSPSQ